MKLILLIFSTVKSQHNYPLVDFTDWCLNGKSKERLQRNFSVWFYLILLLLDINVMDIKYLL